MAQSRRRGGTNVFVKVFVHMHHDMSSFLFTFALVCLCGMEPRAASNKRKHAEEDHWNCTSSARIVLPTRHGSFIHAGSDRDKQLRMLDYAEKADTSIESTQATSKLPKGVIQVTGSVRSFTDCDSLRGTTQAIEWMATKSPEVVGAKRESMIAAIEEIDVKTRRSGVCQHWFGDADVHTRAVAGGANGYLFQTLLRASGYADVECVNLLREGGQTECIRMG